NISKQIVYGVVTDPYCVDGNFIDAHGDWISPRAIEEDSHQFNIGERKIYSQHNKRLLDAQLVESNIEQYPSPEDYQNAMAGKDHSIYRRPFGKDFVHSGSWVVGVKLGDKEWEEAQRGEKTAFSPRGFGRSEDLDHSKMPDVTIIELKEVNHAKA
ncbi:MAG: hypothetical protein GY841_24135, partial [FCB group bacterium]|nr:hypothetical protein [FCB group bacterium]